MSETRSEGRGVRTSRTAPRRRATAPTDRSVGRSAGRRRPVDEPVEEPTRRDGSGARGGTATLEREPLPDAIGDPTPVAEGRRASRRGRGTARTARTEQRTRTPRHRLLLACTGVLALGMLAVLLLNTIISQGAFRQHELEIDLILLAEKEEALARQVQLAETPIEVEKKARDLGMVPAAAPVFLRLSDGRILGEPVPAKAESTPVDFADAPGILPTPDPSASASVSGDATAVDPALDPATGLPPDATGATVADPSAGPSPSANVSGAGTELPSPDPSGQATEGGTP